MRQSKIHVYLLPVVLHGCAVVLGCTVLTGCAAKNSQLATCQAEKEQLLTTIRTQRDTTRDLKTQVVSLESRLDQAEKEIARGGGGNTRISSRPSETPPAVKSESLPWRSPPSKAEPAAPSTNNRRTSSMQAASDPSLLALARRDRRVQYDAAARAARFELPIDFDNDAATLTAQDKRQLDELARLLKSDDARELRVMVAGYSAGRPSTTAPKADGEDRFTSSRQLGAARAQAVADYLDRHGIAQERLGISGTGARPGSDKVAARGVQIYLLEPDAPVVGWGPGEQPLRR